MKHSFNKLIAGYKKFREKYASQSSSLMKQLANQGQQPKLMFVACCDSRVDPAILVQCDPGDIFMARNIANIIPPCENDESHHGTSAALEFGICYLEVKHLIIMGHSQCGGIHAYLNNESLHQDDFISRWTDLIDIQEKSHASVDDCAKSALLASYRNALTFSWIKQRIEQDKLAVHCWFFDISSATIEQYDFDKQQFKPLDQS